MNNLIDSIFCCILLRPKLINELYVDESCFDDSTSRAMLKYLKKVYEKYKTFDITLMINDIKNIEKQKNLVSWYQNIIDLEPTPALFYEYQQQLINQHKDKLIASEVKKYEEEKIDMNTLVENLNKITNDTLIIQKANKIQPDEMLKLIRSPDNVLEFTRFEYFNRLVKFKKNAMHVIGARPSEGKSALAINLFCDLCKKYKCIYFNMEMTYNEVLGRMLSIESNVSLNDIISPKSEYQEKVINESALKIYNMNYEIINGSKTVNSIKTKIIKEQKDGHVIAFIDYVGYIVGKQGQNDRERIGEAVRELNNIMRDYDCTIFVIAQVNRNGADIPTMQDLKDSGEIEQTANTIILIHDENKENNEDVKQISLVVPKCRGGKRNVKITATFDKPKQRFEISEYQR